MNLSTWDTISKKPNRSPSISPSYVITEFDRTKRPKIFSHKLGGVDFGRTRDLNAERQRVIDERLGDEALDGFKYKNLGHVYSSDSITPSEGTQAYSYKIYAHGHPLGGTEHGGMESCSRQGLVCESGEGENDLCNPGKCVIGTLSRVRGAKWKYESVNTFGPDDLPLIYYVAGVDKLELRSVLRGDVDTYAQTTPARIGINAPASVYKLVYLPPDLYFSEDFLETAYRRIDERLTNIPNQPKSMVVGIDNRKDLFINKFIISVYPGMSDGYLNDLLSNTVTQEVKAGLTDLFSTLNETWKNACSSIIEEEFAMRFINNTSSFDFISVVYDRVNELFSCIVQKSKSSIKTSRADYSKELTARPVYSRLPGLSEAYRSDPAFSDAETPAQWLTSGTDEFLSDKKRDIDNFYRDFLDPRSCSDLTLDWLAQHVGLLGDLWDSRWDRKIKIAFITNAFGWWDRSSSIDIPGVGTIKTPKGSALESFPFSESSIWTSDEELDNSLDIEWSEIEVIRVEPFDRFTITGYDRYSIRSFNDQTSKISRVYTNDLKIDKNKWNGLIEAKGSWLALAFLSSVFGLKAHTPLELEILDPDRKIMKPKSGLRNAEISAPVLMPYKYDIIQVGTASDAKINNYTNQLVAGISTSCSVEDSKNVFFRLPYYYNRDGKSWDRVTYIANNWMPNNLNVRVQYAYLSADLWAVGDGFFEPDIKSDESILSTPVTLTEDGSVLTTEDSSPIDTEY